MRIGVLGINHKTADLNHREWLAKACYRRLHFDSAEARALSCVPLFTCHRTEVYFCGKDLAEVHSRLLHVLREEVPMPFEHKLYAYFGSDCFAHLAQVTAGLDSMIIAESEIQRQVKQAYEQACLHYTLPSAMHYLFQKSLKLGKHIRTHGLLPKGQITIPKMIYDLCLHLLSDMKAKQCLFIGNSEINRKVLGYFKQSQVAKMALCTRSVVSARDLAEEQRIELLDWSQLSLWRHFDVVVAGTNAGSALIESSGEAVKTRLIFDLGVPRNVDPKLSRHPQLSLFNIDELGQMMEKRQTIHREEIKECEIIIEEKVQRYMTSFQEKTSKAVLQLL